MKRLFFSILVGMGILSVGSIWPFSEQVKELLIYKNIFAGVPYQDYDGIAKELHDQSDANVKLIKDLLYNANLELAMPFSDEKMFTQMPMLMSRVSKLKEVVHLVFNENKKRDPLEHALDDKKLAKVKENAKQQAQLFGKDSVLINLPGLVLEIEKNHIWDSKEIASIISKELSEMSDWDSLVLVSKILLLIESYGNSKWFDDYRKYMQNNVKILMDTAEKAIQKGLSKFPSTLLKIIVKYVVLLELDAQNRYETLGKMLESMTNRTSEIDRWLAKFDNNELLRDVIAPNKKRIVIGLFQSNRLEAVQKEYEELIDIIKKADLSDLRSGEAGKKIDSYQSQYLREDSPEFLLVLTTSFYKNKRLVQGYLDNLQKNFSEIQKTYKLSSDLIERINRLLEAAKKENYVIVGEFNRLIERLVDALKTPWARMQGMRQSHGTFGLKTQSGFAELYEKTMSSFFGDIETQYDQKRAQSAVDEDEDE